MNDTKEFYNLILSSLDNNVFEVEMTNQKKEKFRPLSTAQLKNLIKTIVDTSLTQIQFNAAALAVMKECYVQQTSQSDLENFNVVDKILFLLETRIKSISSTLTVDQGKTTFTIDLQKIKQNLISVINANPELFQDQQITSEGISVTLGLPLLKTEQQVNDEIYKKINFDADDQDQVRKLLGEAFVIELAKSIKSITINDKTLVLGNETFTERQKLIETLPALLIQQVINYVESYKKIINECLVQDKYSLAIDGSLFSLQ